MDASRNYNPEPNLETIRARVIAVNAEDDVINITDQATMETLMKRKMVFLIAPRRSAKPAAAR